MSRWWVVAMAMGCGHQGVPRPVLPHTFDARPTSGEVRVVPALRLHPPVKADYATYVGGLSEGQMALRQERADELDDLAEAVGVALPGEVNGELGDRWSAQFREWSYPVGARSRVEEALRSGKDVDAVLGDLARSVGGDAVLVSWLDDLDAQPLSQRGPQGTLVDTPVGPVVLDAKDEPYLVSARVGVALVARDGEVVLRYRDTFDTVLSGSRGPQTAARDLAHGLAEKVAKVWASDPRLFEGQPEAHRPDPASGSGESFDWSASR